MIISCAECFRGIRCVLASVLGIGILVVITRTWFGLSPHNSAANTSACAAGFLVIYLICLALSARREYRISEGQLTHMWFGRKAKTWNLSSQTNLVSGAQLIVNGSVLYWLPRKSKGQRVLERAIRREIQAQSSASLLTDHSYS